jgi:hypothetical protein
MHLQLRECLNELCRELGGGSLRPRWLIMIDWNVVMALATVVAAFSALFTAGGADMANAYYREQSGSFPAPRILAI